LTDSMTTFAKNFISTSAELKKPFFLYYAFPQPHHPQFASSRCHGKSKNGPYGDAVEEMDASVDDIINHLRESNVLNNTIIWFTSDNGPRGVSVGTKQVGNSGPFRGSKGEIFEGGFRVPSIIYWKDKITNREPDRSMISTLDMFRTLISMAGFETENGVDGFDRSQNLFEKRSNKKKEKKEIRESFLYFFRNNPSKTASAIRFKAFKLIVQIGREVLEKPLLFNVELDPSESVNLYDKEEYKDVIGEIIKVKADLEKDITWGRSVIQDHNEKAMPCCKKTCFDSLTNPRLCCSC